MEGSYLNRVGMLCPREHGEGETLPVWPEVLAQAPFSHYPAEDWGWGAVGSRTAAGEE